MSNQLKNQDPNIDSIDYEDKWMETALMIFLIIFIIALVFIPSEVFMKWSLWWNNIQ